MTKLMARVATAPISWGICEVPGWGHQMEPSRVLAEMRDLGFTHTELGSAGWLPEDPDALVPMLTSFDLGLLAAFVPLVVHTADLAADTIRQATETADMLAAAGATLFNTAPVTSADWEPRREWTTDEMAHMADMFGRIDEICRARGLTQVLHQHVGCVVETAAEVEFVLENCDVAFVLDTGHLAIGGVNPLEFARDHVDRVGLVHLKDLRLDVAARLNAGELSLMEAVQAGLFPSLGNGELPLAEVVSTLESAGYHGWYVIEQDCAITEAPAPGDGPVRDVETSVAFLRGIETSVSSADG